MDTSRHIGYRILEFSTATEEALREIAERLIPHENAILRSWVERQWNVWQPPGLNRQELHNAFRGILRSILRGLHERRIEQCVAELELAGAKLAESAFPFQALIISVHFLEHSYLPYLLDEPHGKLSEWLVGMDQFMHAVLASIATAYFDVQRKELIDEAEVGRLVQECLLADIPGSIQDLEVGHIYASAQERARLGGDFLDSFNTAAGKPAFIIGDLSGHGLPAVSDALMIRSLFKGFVLENLQLADAMTRLNRVLNLQLENDHFATAVALAYEAPGRLSMVVAGHPPPMLCGSSCTAIDIGDIALGINEDAAYSVSTMEIPPGEVFVVYTDGLIEARRDSELFGTERLTSAIEAVCHMPAAAIAEHLLDQSLRFAGGRLKDDVAVLVLKRRT